MQIDPGLIQEMDCQWIWQLLSYDLLKDAFRPTDAVCCLRIVVRQHASKEQELSRCVQHMQKALTQMNIQLDNVVSNLMGKTGMAILRTIMAGERDPHKLATLRDKRLDADEETVARSLYGNYSINSTENPLSVTRITLHFRHSAFSISEVCI